MASGRTHDMINYSTLAVMAGGYIFLKTSTDLSLPSESIAGFIGSYLVGTIWITPDLDLASKREITVRVKKRWGKLGWLWEPYGNMFKHRGVSHTWLIGPMTRLIYLAILMVVIGYPLLWCLDYFGIHINLPYSSVPWDKINIAALFGYYLSQWLHLIADGVPMHHDLTVWHK